MIVYRITNKINNKMYVGITKIKPARRWSQHKRAGHCIIGKAIKCHGADNFEFEVIDKADSIDELKQKEIYWIDYYKCLTPNGYNVLRGGQIHDSWNKGLAGKGVCKSNSGSFTPENTIGEKNHFYGKKHTEETKALVREKQRAWRETEGYREWLEKHKIGMEKSAEFRWQRFHESHANPEWKEQWKKNVALARGYSPIEVYDLSGTLLASDMDRKKICQQFGFNYDLLGYYLRKKKYRFKGFIVKFEKDDTEIEWILNHKEEKKKKTANYERYEIENITTGETYRDIHEAVEKLKAHDIYIRQILVGKARSLGGQILEYKDHPKKEEYRKRRASITKKVQKRRIKCLETGEIFDSITQASEKLGIGRKGINNVLGGWAKTTGKLTFEYEDSNL